MMPTEVRELLHNRAEQVHLHGDFAQAAILGARMVRRRRAITAVVAGALAIVLPLAWASRDSGVNRGTPATRTVTLDQAPAPLMAVARIGPPEGSLSLPYIQAGILHLNGRAIRLPGGAVDGYQLFRSLSNGGVVYQGPLSSQTPPYETAPVNFLDREGRLVTAHELWQADTSNAGDAVFGVDASGYHVVFDVDGRLIRRFASSSWVEGRGAGSQLGGDLVASSSRETQQLWVGSLATGRSATAVLPGAVLATHDGRSLLVHRDHDRASGPCWRLVNYLTGQSLRSWCGDQLPIGFSPSGEWMYGLYFTGPPGFWVDRTDDGARLLDIVADSGTRVAFSPDLPVPTTDDSALLVVVTAENGRSGITSCSIADGRCTVLTDGLKPPADGPVTLPGNWG